jgi:uncharacterized membrane protein YdfJ with MMPL/SSD domain
MAEETKVLVREIRASQVGGGLDLLVTGVTADLLDTISAMYRDFPKVVAYVMATIYVSLLVLFRSVVLPLKAVVMNFLSIFASKLILPKEFASLLQPKKKTQKQRTGHSLSLPIPFTLKVELPRT